MLKAALLAVTIVAPDPSTPRLQAAFDGLTQDFATCHAYFDFKAAWYTVAEPFQMRDALGAQARSGLEGRKVEALANLPAGTFNRRQEATRQDMNKVLDKTGFSALYSAYDGFCEDLVENTGKHFIRHLGPSRQHAPMK